MIMENELVIALKEQIEHLKEIIEVKDIQIDELVKVAQEQARTIKERQRAEIYKNIEGE